MRVGLLADVHANDAALAAVLAALRGQVDRYVFAGDLCGYYPFLAECLALWPESELVGVRGNHDQVLLDAARSGDVPAAYERQYGSAITRALARLQAHELARLEALPAAWCGTLGGVRVALYHGAPWDPLEGRVYPDFADWQRFTSVDAEVIVLGNTHHALARRVAGRLIINPGSVGQARDQHGLACCAVLDTQAITVEHHRIPYAPARLIDDARQHHPEIPYLTEVLAR